MKNIELLVQYVDNSNKEAIINYSYNELIKITG